jgi:hypothetical protein
LFKKCEGKIDNLWFELDFRVPRPLVLTRHRRIIKTVGISLDEYLTVDILKKVKSPPCFNFVFSRLLNLATGEKAEESRLHQRTCLHASLNWTFFPIALMHNALGCALQVG